MAIEDLDSKQELGKWLIEYLESEGLPMGAVSGLQEAVTGGKWTDLTLVNGWSNYGGGFSGAAYCTLPGNLVLLRGVVTKPAEPGETVITTLPASLRTKGALMFDASNETIAARLTLATDGTLVFSGEEAPYVSLANVLYRTGS